MTAQIVYFSHGGGPLPILGDKGHASMVRFMRQLPSTLKKPEAIMLISAHWETREATITGGAMPPLVYDYYGFPSEAYDITYPAPGNPALAADIAKMLSNAGIVSHVDTQRGFDHGMFIPLKLMYPEADIPTVQLSILHNLDPAEHLKLGAGLKPLLEKNVLVIGSGFSFHNLQAFDWSGEKKSDPRNEAFQEWLIATCTREKSQEARESALLHWEKAPYARYCHPREDHLLPLLVCASLAGCTASLIFDDDILGKRALAFSWQ